MDAQGLSRFGKAMNTYNPQLAVARIKRARFRSLFAKINKIVGELTTQKLMHLRGKTVILVDDGVATGATMKAAVETLKRDQVGKGDSGGEELSRYDAG